MVLGVTTAWGREHAERAFKDPSKADLALVRKIATNRSLAEFLRSVGRFMKSMRRSRVRERVPGHTIPIGVTKARELRHLLPIESALLGVGGAVRAHQVARVMSQQAQGRRMYDYAAKGNGPVHVALDISGSMDSLATQPDPSKGEGVRFTRLDLAKHSSKVIVEVMGDGDSVTIISFGSSATVEMNMTAMTAAGTYSLIATLHPK
jgi:hypothetical protein